MDHSHRFHFVAPSMVANVFSDEEGNLIRGHHMNFGKDSGTKPVKPETADRLQRSRDRIRQLKAHAQAAEIQAEPIAKFDPRVASARARLQEILATGATDNETAAPAFGLFHAIPALPFCENKRARLAIRSQRGHNVAQDARLREIIAEDEGHPSLLDRLLHHSVSMPSDALAH